MTVFKTFFKILNKNKFIVILYTVILLVFGGFNMQTSEKSLNFKPSKPSITIVNNDEEVGITKSFIKYIKNNSKTPNINLDENSLDDALFYEDTSYIIYIPKNYHIDFINGKNPNITVKKSNNYNAAYADMIIKRYLNIANSYIESVKDEKELIKLINDTINTNVDININSKIDSTDIDKASFYFNFESYSILACLIYVICLILSIFNNQNIYKRNIISSTNYKKNNRILLLSNLIYAFILWLFYLITSVVLLGEIIFTLYGLVFAINSLLFTICATTIAFFIGSIVTNKNAISGIVNVVALGSSFLCGAFVPTEYLPKSVIKIAHILPTYYYVNTNDLLKEVEAFNIDVLKPIIINMIVIIIFIIIFIILTNIISRYKRKIG